VFEIIKNDAASLNHSAAAALREASQIPRTLRSTSSSMPALVTAFAVLHIGNAGCGIELL
jgi:hypothetical protein